MNWIQIANQVVNSIFGKKEDPKPQPKPDPNPKPQEPKKEEETKTLPKSYDPKELAPEDRLSEHFTYEEMIASQTAVRKGIDNTPTSDEVRNFVQLLFNVMEPIRKHYGKPVLITSGYRSPKLNEAIGGSDTSQHMKGEAADFRVHKTTLRNVFEWIILESGLEFDQIIWEFGRWIHISYSSGGDNRNMILVASKNGGSYDYSIVDKQTIRNGSYL